MGRKRAIRMAKSRNQSSADVMQAKLIKDENGRTLTEDEDIQRRWKDYFENLLNVENPRERREI